MWFLSINLVGNLKLEANVANISSIGDIRIISQVALLRNLSGKVVGICVESDEQKIDMIVFVNMPLDEDERDDLVDSHLYLLSQFSIGDGVLQVIEVDSNVLKASDGLWIHLLRGYTIPNIDHQ